MKSSKKIIAAMLAVILTVSVAACGSSSGTTPAPQPSDNAAAKPADAAPSGGGTLTLWTINKDAVTLGLMEKAAENFEAETGFKVEITMTENDPYKTKLKTVMGSGEAPDIFHSWGGNWLKQFVDEGQVLDITDGVAGFKDQIYEAAWELNTYDSKTYAVPYALSGALLFYNKPMFEKYGIEFPKTWSEMETACATLKDNGVIPFALGNSSKWPGALFFIYSSLRYGGHEVFENALARNGNNTFEDESYIKSGKLIQDMVDKGWFPDGANGINYDTGGSRMLFYTEKCAMMIITSQFIVNCFSENPDFFNNNLAIAPFPAFEDGKGSPDEVLCGNNAYSISKNTQYPEQALAFLKYFTTDPAVNNEMANDANIMIAYKNADIQSEYVRAAIDILTGTDYMQNYYDQALPVELGELHKDTTQALFGLTMTPEEAAKQMEEKAKEILG